MTIDPRTPVIAGVGQVRQQVENPPDAAEPLAMMIQAARLAASDAGAPNVAGKADLVVAIKGAWRYTDPARLVANALGSGSSRSVLTADGGHVPMVALQEVCHRIQAGKFDIGVIVGGEGVWSRRRARASGRQRTVTDQPDGRPDEVLGSTLRMSSEHELQRGLSAPINVYPLFESAIRARNRESIEQNRDLISGLWAGFSKAASTNPYAWSPSLYTATEIREASTVNRMVAFPYTKWLTSNWDVDLASSLIVCSFGMARRVGVPLENLIFPVAGTVANDADRVSHRLSLGDSPAIRAAGRKLHEIANVDRDSISHIDLYSCFPSAVRASQFALGLDNRSDLTVTGGMTFAGGPLNTYVLHSLSTMVERLRGAPTGHFGLVTGNGGYLTKHALGLLSNSPFQSGYRWSSAQGVVSGLGSRMLKEQHQGSALIEAYTVMHDRGGAERALLSCRINDGRRTWATSDDPGLMRELQEHEHVGARVQLSRDGLVQEVYSGPSCTTLD